MSVTNTVLFNKAFRIMTLSEVYLDKYLLPNKFRNLRNLIRITSLFCITGDLELIANYNKINYASFDILSLLQSRGNNGFFLVW